MDGLEGVGLSVDDHVFELEADDTGGVEVVVRDGNVEILQEDIADVVWPGLGLMVPKEVYLPRMPTKFRFLTIDL